MNIVRVDIVDNDLSPAHRVQDTYYLVNPNEEKLQELKDLVESRFETGDLEQYSEIRDFINTHFNTVDIEIFEIAW